MQQDYRGVRGLQYDFGGRTYLLCRVEQAEVTPEEYSLARDDGWCGLPAIDVASRPIRNSIYPICIMYSDWDEKHEQMHPTEVDPWDDSSRFDLEIEEHVFLDESTDGHALKPLVGEAVNRLPI